MEAACGSPPKVRFKDHPPKVQGSGCGGLRGAPPTPLRKDIRDFSVQNAGSRRALQQQAGAQRAEGEGRRAPSARRRGGSDGGGAHSPSSPRPAALLPQPGAGALGSFRHRRCRALPCALRHLRQFPSGPGRHFLAACVSRWLRGSVLVSEALSGSAMDGYVMGPARRCVRGELYGSSAGSGVVQKPSGGPSLGLAAVTQPPPHRTHPSLRFPRRAPVEKMRRKRACRLERHWGDGGGDDLGGGAGTGLTAGDGAGTLERLARPCPLLGAISIRSLGPEPWVAAPVEASVVPQRPVWGLLGERREASVCTPAVPSLPGLTRPALAGGDAGGGSSGES